MFPPLGVATAFPGIMPYLRHPTRYKRIKVLAKIDGENWYDISSYVKQVKISNRLEFLESPALDSAQIVVANLNNEWTSTVYNDVFDPASGKFNGTADQAYLEKEWEVKIILVVSTDDGDVEIPLFYGVKTGLKEEHKTATIQLSDILYWASKKKLKNTYGFINKHPHEVITYLLDLVGYDSTLYDIQEINYPVTYFAKAGSTVWRELAGFVRSIGGKISTTPAGKIIFRSRIDASTYSDPDTAASISQDAFKAYDLDTNRQYNKVILTSDSYTAENNTSYVIDVRWEGEAREIAADEEANFELDYVSDYAINVSDTIEIAYWVGTGYSEASLTVSESNPQPSDGNIQITQYVKYADHVLLTIKNLLTTTSVAIEKVRIQGIKVNHNSTTEVVRENTTSEPDKEYSLTTYFADDAVVQNLADILYDDINKRIHFGLDMNEFYGDIYAGNLVKVSIPEKGITDGTFLVLSVEHDLQPTLFRTSLRIVEWSGLGYETGAKTVTRALPGDSIPGEIQVIQEEVDQLQEQVEELDDRTDYIDGVAPSTPTNLTLNTALTASGESVVRAYWDASPEADVIGYEFAWSVDGVNWRILSTSDTKAEVVVPGNTTIYGKVRAFDAEGKKSPWSEIVQITSAKDTTPPGVPTGLSAEGLFQKVIVRWNPNSEKDFSHYIVQYDTTDTFSSPQMAETRSTQFIINGAVDTTYYIRVKAVDTSGNESDWSEVVSATTAKAYDEDIESQRLNQAEQNIQQLQQDVQNLDNELQNLDQELDNKLDDLPGVITTTHISDDAITTPKIAANAVTANEIAAGAVTAEKIAARAVTSEKIAAGAITAYHVGSNEIITNSANIADAVIEEAHIKDGAIGTAKIKNSAITNAKIANLAVDDAKIASVDAGKIKTGYLDADRIATKSITFDKLAFSGAFNVPPNAIAYWRTSLVDELYQHIPWGYETSLHPMVTLLPENAPEGSVVGDLIAGNQIYAGHKIQVGDSVTIETTADSKGRISVYDGSTAVVQIGEGVLPNGSNGIKITNGWLETAKVGSGVFTSLNDSKLAIISKVNATSRTGGAFLGQWYARVSSWQDAWLNPPSFNYPFLFPSYLWFLTSGSVFNNWQFYFWWYIPLSKMESLDTIKVRIDLHDDETAVYIKDVNTGSVYKLLSLSGADYSHYYEATKTLNPSHDYILMATVHNGSGVCWLWFGFSFS